MKPGSIVVVDWRDALLGTNESNKTRPAIVVGRADIYGESFGYLLVVPLTTFAPLAVTSATLAIPPSKENACVQPSYALAWNVQTVPMRRVRATKAHITREQLDELRDQIARLVER